MTNRKDAMVPDSPTDGQGEFKAMSQNHFDFKAEASSYIYTVQTTMRPSTPLAMFGQRLNSSGGENDSQLNFLREPPDASNGRIIVMVF